MTPVDALTPGMHLGYRYRLVDRLGRGGMASVWRAVDQVLDRLVAVKVLAPWLMADGDFLERFRIEARAAAQLTHPHITSVFDYGEWDLPGGERVAFIVMELLDGESLAARLQRGSLPWPRAVDLCAQVAQALTAAHRRGMVHRDVKPANVVLIETGAKVLDFGIAAMAGEGALTSSGGVLGTAAYVAPELLAGELVTPAADVYGLGMVLFESLTGRRPLAGEVEPVAPELPAEVAVLVRRCLARRPAERPSSAEVAKRLQAALGIGSWHDPASPSRPPGASDTALLPPLVLEEPVTWTLASRAARRRSRRSLVVGALGAALALTVTAVTVIALRSTPGERGPAGATTTTTAGAAASAPASSSSSTTEPVASQPLDALARVQRSVDEGIAAEEIREDVAHDLDNLIGELHERLADGRLRSARERVEKLQRKVEERVQEGAIAPARAGDLSRALSALAQTLPAP
jgi:eukaryotic-like serine/threonine-protein kinase